MAPHARRCSRRRRVVSGNALRTTCRLPVSQSLPHALSFHVTRRHISSERQDPRRAGNLAFACEEPPFLKERRKSRLPDHDSEYLDATKPNAPPNEPGEGPENARLQNARIELIEGGGASRLEALAIAVQALIGGGLASQAKPLVDELVALNKPARGPRAQVSPFDPSRRRDR